MSVRAHRIAERLVSEYTDEFWCAAYNCCTSLIPVIQQAFVKRLGREAPPLPEIVVKVDDDLPDGKVGSYKVPNGEHEEGILTVNPGAFNGEKAPYWHVIAHELIHAFLGPESENHKGDFYELADELGIPEEYRD